MPEIAEVRTVKNVLNKKLRGRKIISIETPYSKIIQGSVDEFKNTLTNKSFKSVENVGKWLIFNLGEYSFLSHLRMEGKYFIKESSLPYEKHEHIIFHLDNDEDLRYHDTRKFGVMKLVKTSKITDEKEIKKLGIEPDDKSLTKEYLKISFKGSKKPIKELLLDQTIINGLGNIYVDEVLFESCINPTKEASKITLDECEKIIESCKKIIPKATKCGGTTIRSYTSSLGVTGTYQKYLCVHTKEGEPCPRCGNTIKKIRVGGRGTYLCVNCQK